jgi:hypothetical protein
MPDTDGFVRIKMERGSAPFRIFTGLRPHGGVKVPCPLGDKLWVEQLS